MITPSTLIKFFKSQNLTLALAESMTCGLAASKLCSAKGTSEILKGGIICYAPEVKRYALRVPQKVLDIHTCESKETTVYMVKGLRKIIKADVYAGITGLAAPGGSENKQKPIGTVFIAVMFKSEIYNIRLLVKGTPAIIRSKACTALYQFILQVVKKRMNKKNAS